MSAPRHAPCCISTPSNVAPTIPDAFTAVVITNTTGTSHNVPHGLTTMKEYYDYHNKRLRKDAPNGVTKVYRYDKQVMPPVQPSPGDPKFACAKGYQFELADPDNTCCWLWLVEGQAGWLAR